MSTTVTLRVIGAIIVGAIMGTVLGNKAWAHYPGNHVLLVLTILSSVYVAFWIGASGAMSQAHKVVYEYFQEVLQRRARLLRWHLET